MTTPDEKEKRAVKQAKDTWDLLGGSELEPSLESGAIALVNASWLVEYAADASNIICYRQQLPAQAFLTLEQVRSATRDGYYGGFHIIALSYMWLHPSHPDPKGTTLRTLAAMLQSYLDDGFPVWGVFWDFVSLYQHSSPHTGQLRTPQEESKFQEGLKSLSIFYSHKGTVVFKVTKLPPGYPDGYDLPSGANCSPYDQRGWPFTESSWASMTKSSLRTLDISHKTEEKSFFATRISRRAPLVPRLFDQEPDKLSFTNKKRDKPLVSNLYRQGFVKQFSEVIELDYSALKWHDEEVVRVAEILSGGYAPQLKSLHLGKNLLGLRACQALADMLVLKRSPIKELILFENPDIGDEGCTMLANVIVTLEHVSLNCIGISDLSCHALLEAATKHETKLVYLELCRNQISDDGCQALMSIAQQCPSLKTIDIRDNPASEEAKSMLHLYAPKSYYYASWK
jgi:hypothetical protein